MTPSRVVRSLSLFLLLAALPTIAFAATTEFRVLFDTDADSTTGCKVGAFEGVEQVLVTQVANDDTTPQVTRTFRQVCTAGALGAPVDEVTTGWPSVFRSGDRLLTLETRIPFSAFGSGMPESLHVGFDVTRGAASQQALVNIDGTPVFIPAAPRRRHAVGDSSPRTITLDGALLDWGAIKPIISGIVSDGTQALRLLRVYSFSNPADSYIYFAAQTRISSDTPFADDDLYERDPGQDLNVAAAAGVLQNDGDPHGLPLTATKVSEPRRGTVTLNPDGSFTYSPNNAASQLGDEFEYKATTGTTDSNVARVLIKINNGENPEGPPVDDEYETDEDKTLVVAAPGVLENDPGSQNLVASLHTPPSHGVVTLNADGGFTYKPTINFFGTDTFVYTATRTTSGHVVGNATVTIEVSRVNDPPSFTPGGNITRPANAGPYSAIWATNIVPGPSNESGQTVTFVVTNNNNSLFTVQPAISSNGTLTFTPAGTLGSATVTVYAQDNGGTANGGDNTSDPVTFTITITCPNITVNKPATTTATVGTAFSQTFTQSGAVGTATFTTSSTLPAGLSLSTTGVLSGTPTQSGTFPIVVSVTDSNGCTGVSSTYTLVVSCQTITVTNPATSTGTASSPFSQTFTQSGALGGATFTTSSTLPAGLSLSTGGVLSGTPTQTGSFPIVVTVTDGNGCTGTGPTYNLVIGCQTITVTNPGASSATANSPFSATFTQSGGIGTTTFSLASGTLPAGMTLAANGTLSGTPTQTGSFPITVTATDSNGCTGTGATYTLTVGCQTITVNNPSNANGTANAPFSETFTATNTIGTTTFTLASGTLPTGLTLAANGTLSGTPTQTGSFPITVTATDANGCQGTSATYTIVIACQTITVTNPANTTGTVSLPFSEQFTQTGAIGTATFTTASTLPAGLTLSTSGLLSGTPTQNGTFPITVTVTDSNGCTGTSATYTLIINCQTITVTNPVNTTGAAGSPFSETFTQTGAVGTATFTLASGTLPTGITLATNGVLSGTPTQNGSFPITVLVTDANGCTGTSATYTLVITCQTITVNNPANGNGTANSAFSETFTQTGAIGSATFTLASGTLPAGLTLSTAGVLSGTPTQTGSFPITVMVTDANGCTGTSATYTINIACQTITVTNPVNANGTANSAFSETFTQSGAIGTATFTLNSGTLPAGLTLGSNGVLSGTPTQTGSFPITVLVTDANGCTGTSTTYTITIACQTITVTNPSNATGPAGSPFSETFTQTGAIGTATFTLASGSLPTGLTLAANGVLSGTPTQGGTFPITVLVTDSNGCTGTSSTYNLIITCPTITVTNPVNGNGTAGSPFSETFSSSGGVGTMTYTLASGALPAGLSLSTGGVLSGTPTVVGSFPITVTATDQNGCTGTGSTYTIVIGCQTITVNNPATSTGTANSAFSQTFTQTGGIGTMTFTLASGTLPAGLTLATNGTLSGTPTQTGSFPITVTATDANGCQGTGTTYNLTVGCQTITVTNPGVTTGTVNAPFSQTFTQSGGIGTMTFTLASGTLPAGLTLASNGTLSGTPTQSGAFPITVTATDANGCSGTGTTYNLVIGCQTITVINPGNANGTVNAAFSETFTQSGAVGSATFTLASGTLPTGLTLAANGTLSGTPTQSGSFPITVTATDSNGCTGTGTTYPLNISCQIISVTNPVNTSGTAGTVFTETFTQTGAVGTATFTTASTLPAGLVLQTNGTLTGTPTSVGTFPIVVTVTDSNGCTGTGTTYNLVIGCQTISITNPATNSVQAGQALSATFTATGILGTANWTLETGTLPTGITLNATTGELAGTTTQQGTYPITVRVTDSNGCFAISSTYTLTVTCPVITVTRTGGGSFPAGTFNSAYAGQSVTASGGTGPYTFQVTSGTLPTGLSLAANGTISGTPTATGTFTFTVTATDAALCTGSQSFSIAIQPAGTGDSYSNLVNNTQAVVTGGSTASPSTPFVPLTGTLIANDLPSGGVTIVAGTVATTQGGSVTIAADGTFIYTPPVTVNALATDTFTYTISSDTGGTGTPVLSTGTATLNLVNRVWYVKNDGPNGDGRSHSPFNSTSNFVNPARTGPDKPGDIIYIYRGDGTTTNLNTGVVLLNTEQLIGEGVALVVNTNTLVAAGLQPQLTIAAGNVIELANGNTVRGLTTTGGTNGISGTTKTGFTGGTLTLQNATGSGLSLTTFAGTVTLTNTTITNNGTGVTLNGGTPAVTIDNTNSITANAGQRSINFVNLGATAVVTVGASITDNGLGMLVNTSASGAAISFTGTQSLSTTTNTAVSMSTNTGATITFSGALGISTTTGSGFVATAGGTLNVLGTANITTGAAVAALSLSGMTVGGSGVTFNSVSSTGATTGISLVNVAGLVTVNGGTIQNGVTGIALQGASTSLTISNLTIGGTTTTGITNTTNFGTLTIGASVSVSAATALNLTTGAISGTFASVTSTGGVNGVSLTSISGTWGATAGALSGATGATFNVSGGSGNITWGPTISQANAANVVTIAGGNSATINFGGNVTSSAASTGLSISASSGTYNFNGAANAFSGAGGITIGPSESGAITFSNGTTITTAGSAFVVAGGGGAVTAAITYSGTITKNSGGILISVDNLDSPGTLTMTHTPAAAGNLTQNSNGASGISVINSSSTNITISNASVTFQNTAAGFTASGNTGGTINLPGLALTGSGNKAGMLISGAGTINVNAGAANPSINLSAGTNAASKAIDGTAVSFTGTLNLTNAAITGNATAGADIVTLTGSTLGGTGSTISGANRALVLSGVALTNGAGMATVTSSGGANGISLTNVTGGPYTIGGGSLASNTGASFLVSGGTRTITYAGTITQSTAAQRAVDIQSSTGGTINFTGAISSTTGGIFANSNTGTTMSYRGGVSLTTTTNAAFTATAGGTVEVCDENPCNNAATGALVNTITTTTGVALNVANTTISANNLEFRSIAANGAANGIILNTTGASGGLKVKGTGGAGTGGTIQSTTGVGILMTSTDSPSFSFMNVQSAGDDGIRGQTVNNLTMITCTLTNNGNATAENGLQLGEASGLIVGITGTLTLTNVNISASAGNNVHIRNTSGTLTAMNISGGSFNDLNDVTGANSFLFEMSGTAVTTAASITGGTQFNNNSPQRALEVQTHDTGTISAFTVNGASFNNNGIHASFTQDTSSNLTFSMLNNNMQFADPLHAINIFSSSTSTGGSITGTVEGNTIGTAASANSGAKGNAIRIALQGRTVGSFKIHNNTIRQVWLAGAGARGLDFQFLGPTAAAQPITQSDIMITNNDVDTMAPASSFPGEAFFLAADNQGSPARVRAQITGNNFRNSVAGGSYGYPTFDGNGAQLVYIENVPTADGQLVDTGAVSANALAELQTANPATTSTRIYQSGITLIPGPIVTPP